MLLFLFIFCNTRSLARLPMNYLDKLSP